MRCIKSTESWSVGVWNKNLYPRHLQTILSRLCKTLNYIYILHSLNIKLKIRFGKDLLLATFSDIMHITPMLEKFPVYLGHHFSDPMTSVRTHVRVQAMCYLLNTWHSYGYFDAQTFASRIATCHLLSCVSCTCYIFCIVFISMKLFVITDTNETDILAFS